MTTCASTTTENAERFTTPEERRASHILVKADKDAPKAERDKAKAKAEALLAEVRKNPSSFAEVAQEVLRRRRLGGQGRRSRLLRPRRDGQAVRGRGLRARSPARSAASSRATSAITSSSSPRCAAARRRPSRRCARRSRARCAAAGPETFLGCRRRVRRHRLRAARQPEAGRRQVEADQGIVSPERLFRSSWERVAPVLTQVPAPSEQRSCCRRAPPTAIVTPTVPPDPGKPPAPRRQPHGGHRESRDAQHQWIPSQRSVSTPRARRSGARPWACRPPTFEPIHPVRAR